MQRIVFGAALGSTFVVVMLSGCVGDDPGTTASSTDGGSNETGTSSDGSGIDLAPDAAPPALCPLNCLPPAPPGWTGPDATYDGAADAKPAACPSLYTQKAAEAHRGMTAKAPECGCGTPTFQGNKCVATVVVYGDAVCDPQQAALLVGDVSSEGPCLQVNISATQGLQVDVGTFTRGTCSFPTPVKNIEAAKFDGVEVACSLPQLAACENRADCIASPLPDAPFTRLCIHKDGNHQCPSADYAVKVSAMKTFADTRDCTACTNPVAAGGACGTKWGTQASAGGCTGAIPTTHNSGNACANYTKGEYVDIRGMTPVGVTCSATGGLPTGAATSTDDITFCCNR